MDYKSTLKLSCLRINALYDYTVKAKIEIDDDVLYFYCIGFCIIFNWLL
jgi:hypothetical protein